MKGLFRPQRGYNPQAENHWSTWTAKLRHVAIFPEASTLSYQTQESISELLPLGKSGAIFLLMGSAAVSFRCQLDTNQGTGKHSFNFRTAQIRRACEA